MRILREAVKDVGKGGLSPGVGIRKHGGLPCPATVAPVGPRKASRTGVLLGEEGPVTRGNPPWAAKKTPRRRLGVRRTRGGALQGAEGGVSDIHLLHHIITRSHPGCTHEPPTDRRPSADDAHPQRTLAFRLPRTGSCSYRLPRAATKPLSSARFDPSWPAPASAAMCGGKPRGRQAPASIPAGRPCARAGVSGPAIVPGSAGQKPDHSCPESCGRRHRHAARQAPGRCRRARLLGVDQQVSAIWPKTVPAGFRSKKHWSFQPLKVVEPPADPRRHWSSAIDRFLAAKLLEHRGPRQPHKPTNAP